MCRQEGCYAPGSARGALVRAALLHLQRARDDSFYGFVGRGGQDGWRKVYVNDWCARHTDGSSGSAGE
jgi:hypothetical protein